MHNSKQNLLDIVDEQKKTIEKYSNKLRDVVAAHKSLLVEKKALEDTIKILNDSRSSEGKSETSAASDNDDKESKYDNSSIESEEESKSQVSSLLASISSLVAEKSHMEECFKVNQKQLLDDKKMVENKCKELQEEVKTLTKQLKSLENKTDFFSRKDSKKQSKNTFLNVKSKNDVDENNESWSAKVKNYEKELKILKSELEAKNIIQDVAEKKLKEYNYELANLQEEVRNLQIEHQSALLLEKEKAKDVEDRAKQLTAAQEERVVCLESRLAELSETIGTYDRLRLQDQTEIQKLKEHISQIDLSHHEMPSEPSQIEPLPDDDYDSIVNKIIKLKKHLETVAIKLGKEGDFKNLFPETNYENISHSLCKEEYNKVKAELELLKTKMKVSSDPPKSGKEVVVLENQIKNLQEKVRVLGEKNKIIEKEYQVQIDHLKKTMNNEKARFKEALEVSGLDFRGRVWLLEEQLQKQRERSLAMLEEKEQEIQALQSTFQMFLPGYVPKTENEPGEGACTLAPSQFPDGPHMIHYANELARRDIEISSLRKKKHQVEMTLRDLQKEIVSLKEKHKEDIESCKKEISRLERCQTREGANLEYLKNVVYNFLLSSDPKSKRHMCNAIAAVLKFSETELQTVIDHSKNKWWTKSSYKG